ncbi:hypothetical protein PA598K_07290, partial [Paenibacillus sp. 598K]
QTMQLPCGEGGRRQMLLLLDPSQALMAMTESRPLSILTISLSFIATRSCGARRGRRYAHCMRLGWTMAR